MFEFKNSDVGLIKMMKEGFEKGIFTLKFYEESKCLSVEKSIQNHLGKIYTEKKRLEMKEVFNCLEDEEKKDLKTIREIIKLRKKIKIIVRGKILIFERRNEYKEGDYQMEDLVNDINRNKKRG